MADPRNWFGFGAAKISPAPTKLVFGGGASSSPGSPGVATPMWDVEKDTDTLFREHGIQEIKQIEKQTRLDIDSRREGLRQMVGAEQPRTGFSASINSVSTLFFGVSAAVSEENREKYRDLIDAADSIVDMQKCSIQVKHSVETMAVLCQKLQQTHFLKGSGGMRGPLKKNETHEVAAQLKLLADCPERMWVCLEGRGYLQAAQHYLLARHVFSQLGLCMGGKGLGGGTSVQKLWQPIANFKDTILECCHCHLQCSDLEEGPMVQSLCAMVLLEGCSPRQAFTQFLLARKAAIQSAFQPGSGVGHHRSVKNQICHLVKTLLHSLLHIAAIFCQQQTTGKKEMSLLLQQLQQFSPKNNQEGQCSHLLPDTLLAMLPASIAAFTPTLRSTLLSEIPPADIHSSTEDWITMCAADVQGGVAKLLQHVTSVKAISSIKAAVHSLLATPTAGAADSSDSTPWAEHWDGICRLILDRKLSIWDTFFQPVLLQRVKLLLEKRFSSCGSRAATHLSNLLNSISSDPSGYHGDIHCHSHLWEENNSGYQNGSRLDGGVLELSLKSKACTPSIYGFCQDLGREMDGLIEDVSHYIQPPDATPPFTPTLSSYKSKQLDAFPFPQYADTASIQDFLQQSAVQWITRFLQHVDVKVEKLRQSVGRDGGSLEQTELAIDMLLVVARICQCLLECCQSLSYLVKGARHKPASSTTKRSLSGHVGMGHFNKEANQAASSAADLLQKRAISIFKIWADWTAQQVTQHLGSRLSSDTHLSSLASSLVWSEITISEEAESGKKVSSVIRVPSQASTYVSALLFTLSQEIGHVGGHALDRRILEYLSGATLVGVVKVYEDLLGELQRKHVEVPQQCALQLFYNLKFLTGVLTPPKDSEEDLTKQIRGVLERLQGWVDPFDLDVFMPFLLSNLESQLSRSSVMLGVLLAIRGSLHRPHGPAGSSSGSGQDKHMLLPLAPVVGRIQVLPLSSRPNRLQHHHKVMALQDLMPSSTLLQRMSYFHHL